MISSLTGTSWFTLALLAQCLSPEACLPQEQFTAKVEWSQEITNHQTEIAMEDPIVKMGKTAPTTNTNLPAEVKLDVPFTSQAPFKDWSEPYDEACEEASLAMVEFYLQGKTFTPETASVILKNLVARENEKGWTVDISSLQVGQLAKQIYARNYIRYTGNEVTTHKMKELLAAGNPIILPTAGRTLNNPNFQGSGPPYHMIVLTGYNADGFYAHDPGTQSGAHYLYSYQTIEDATHEWTGDRNTIDEGQKAMLIIQKPTAENPQVAAYSF